jgi:hypothetical protein
MVENVLKSAKQYKLDYENEKKVFTSKPFSQVKRKKNIDFFCKNLLKKSRKYFITMFTQTFPY